MTTLPDSKQLAGQSWSLSPALGSAQLPDDFTIEVSDYAVMRSGVSPREFERQWKEARADLIRRGYRVTEWRDEATMQGKARCQLLPNVV